MEKIPIKTHIPTLQNKESKPMFQSAASFLRYFTTAFLVAIAITMAPGKAIGAMRIGTLKADRILFLGNSLTLHPPKPEIGWNGHWGMFASAVDKDYVHLVGAAIEARTGGKLTIEPAPASGHAGAENVINIANILEREYRTYDASKIRKQIDWKADIVILQFGENVPKTGFDAIAFEKALKLMLADLENASHPQIFITGNILNQNPVLDTIKKNVCAEEPLSCTFVDFTHFSRNKSLFGELGHPNDAGMKQISEGLVDAMVLKSAPVRLILQTLPAFVPKSRILFQGDSITDGNRGRTTDPNHILGHGYVFIIAARHGAAFPEWKLDFMNRGISGNTVVELQNRWQKETLDLKPDLLSVLIGVNDSGRKIPLDQYETVYDGLLSSARAANPKLKLVLCETFQLDHRSAEPATGSPNLDLVKRQAVVKQLAEKHKAAFVPFQKTLDDACRRAPAAYWIWDGVHPTYAGHQLLADAWEMAVREYFKGGN